MVTLWKALIKMIEHKDQLDKFFLAFFYLSTDFDKNFVKY